MLQVGRGFTFVHDVVCIVAAEEEKVALAIEVWNCLPDIFVCLGEHVVYFTMFNDFPVEDCEPGEAKDEEAKANGDANAHTAFIFCS